MTRAVDAAEQAFLGGWRDSSVLSRQRIMMKCVLACARRAPQLIRFLQSARTNSPAYGRHCSKHCVCVFHVSDWSNADTSGYRLEQGKTFPDAKGDVLRKQLLHLCIMQYIG